MGRVHGRPEGADGGAEMSAYPEGISGSDLCYMEGCTGRGPCPRCGKTNYALMGWYGAVARWAKAWGVSEDEAEKRIIARQIGAEGAD